MESLTEIDRLTGAVYLLRDLIQERLGLALDDNRGISLIINRLAGRLQQRHCQSFWEYYHFLMADGTTADNEWRYVMAALAKSISSFWRHTGPVRALVDIVLPELLSQSRPEPLRIWSASCGAGEEPLAIAMALKEAGWFARIPIEIHASDANPAAIERAIQGIYSEERMRSLDVNLRDKYFSRESGGWQVRPELHQLIQWKVANLMIPNEVADLAQSQIVFCRNVFIYFTGHAICKTLNLFARFMPARAYLFSDSGEFFTRLISYSKLFEPLRINGSSIWIRRDLPPNGQ
jgi:chemotaxis protein methyltransferase CheR